jgi:hypothetical protein
MAERKKITFLTYDKGINKQYTIAVTWSVIDGKTNESLNISIIKRINDDDDDDDTVMCLA